MFWQQYSTARAYKFPIIWSLKLAWHHRNGPNAKLREMYKTYKTYKDDKRKSDA